MDDLTECRSMRLWQDICPTGVHTISWMKFWSLWKWCNLAHNIQLCGGLIFAHIVSKRHLLEQLLGMLVGGCELNASFGFRRRRRDDDCTCAKHDKLPHRCMWVTSTPFNICVYLPLDIYHKIYLNRCLVQMRWSRIYGCVGRFMRLRWATHITYG